MQQSTVCSSSARGRQALQLQRSSTPPRARARSVTPPRARPSSNEGRTDDSNAWIKRTAEAAMLGIASLGVAASPAAAHTGLFELPVHTTVVDNIAPFFSSDDLLSAAVQQQARRLAASEQQSEDLTAGIFKSDQQLQALPHVLQQLEQQVGQLEQRQQKQKLKLRQQRQDLHGQQQQHEQAVQQCNHIMQDTTATQAAELEALQAQLARVREAESDAFKALKAQEESLLRLARQLKEAAHSEISSLQATEGRLLAVINKSAMRLKEMQQQQQNPVHPVLRALEDPKLLVKIVLSGSFVMAAGSAAATAAAAYAATRSTFIDAVTTSKLKVANSGSGGSNGTFVGSGSPGTGTAPRPGGPPPAARGAVIASAGRGTVLTGEQQDEQHQDWLQQQQQAAPSSWRTSWRSTPTAANTSDSQPLQMHLPKQVVQAPFADLLAGNDSVALTPEVMQHLQAKAAEAAAAAQALHALQQQDAEAAVKSAELAASSLEAERRVAEAMRAEALAAQQLVEVERSAKEAAEEYAHHLSQEVIRLQGRLILQQKGWGPRKSPPASPTRRSPTTSRAGSPADAPPRSAAAAVAAAGSIHAAVTAAGETACSSAGSTSVSTPASTPAGTTLPSRGSSSGGGPDVATGHSADMAQQAGGLSKQQGGNGVALSLVQKQLSEAHDRLAAATKMRAAAETELRELTCALLHEQQQSAEIAQQLESTQDKLEEASAELCSLQHQLHAERAEHDRSFAAAQSQAAAAQQTLQTQHERQLEALRLQQQEELCALQMSEQRLGDQLADAKAQLAAVLQELDMERNSSGQLHQEVTRLHHQFEDARVCLQAERARASALTEERNRLEAALQAAADQALAAQAQAAAARAEAEVSAAQAQQAAEEADLAQQRLAVAEEEKQAVQVQLQTVSFVAEQQQEALQAREQQVGQLQKVVVDTRDALKTESARARHLESTTAELHQRIANMASVRETSNTQLSGQLNNLRAQLEASKKRQQESAAQLETFRGRLTSSKQQLAKEKAVSTTFKSTVAELRQRITNMRATSAHHTAAATGSIVQARGQQQQAVAAASAAQAELQQTSSELHQVKQQLASEQAEKADLSKKSQELQQRLANLRAAHAQSAVLAASATEQHAALAAAEQQRSAAAAAELHETKIQLKQLEKQHQEQLENVQGRLVRAEKQAADVVKSAEAAVQEQEQQLVQVREQLTASQAQAAAAQAAEQAARAEVLALQLQVEQHKEEARKQADALEAVKAQMRALRQRAAENRQQLETERERALAHEDACLQLQERIATLQELRQHQQLLHGQQVNSLLMQIKEAQNQILLAAEQRRKAEDKVLTARDDIERRQKELTMAHKQQQELEARLANITAAGQATHPLMVQLQEQLTHTSCELGIAAGELGELEQHYLDARGELAVSEAHAQDLVQEVQQLQQHLEAAAAAAQAQAHAAAEEQRALQEQLREQQLQQEQDRLAIEGLQKVAFEAKEELSQQQQLALTLQKESEQLHRQLSATEAAKEAAECKAVQLVEQLTEAQEELSVLQHAQVETEQLAAQVAADLAAAREWANENTERFIEVQKQLGSYQMDLAETQEDLRLASARLEVAEAQHNTAQLELMMTKEQLAAEQAAHGTTHHQLATTRVQLEALKHQYLATRDELELERQRSEKLQQAVEDLKGRLLSLQQLRDQQNKAVAVEKARWEPQVLEMQAAKDKAKHALEELQQEYFTAYERLDFEQTRVQGLEDIVTQLEVKLTELQQLALEAPSAGALELGGGPAAELVVASSALREQWKEARAALQTSRNMMSMLEHEYKESRVAVDAEHEHYSQVEASLEFLQERLTAVEQAGAGEAAEYDRSTAELHEQLELQASKLVASQLRIAALKDELEDSKRRLEDEQSHEAELAQRALQLEAEAEAARRSVADFEVDFAGNAVVKFNTARASFAAQEATVELSEALASAMPGTHFVAPAAAADSGNGGIDNLASLEAEQLLEQLDQVLGNGRTAAGASSSSRAPSPTGSSGSGVGVDMEAVRKHVEEMAKQYVKRLSEAEEELRAVRTVWQQAEAELAALRRQQPPLQLLQPADSVVNILSEQQEEEESEEEDDREDAEIMAGRRSPSLTGYLSSFASLDDDSTYDDHVVEAAPGSSSSEEQHSLPGHVMHELVQLAPVNAPQHVSGSSHAAADEGHGMQGQIRIELPAPVFGNRSSSNSMAGHQDGQQHGSDNTPQGLVGMQGARMRQDLGFNGLPRATALSAEQQEQEAWMREQQQQRAGWRTPVVAAAAAAEHGAPDALSEADVAELQQAAEAGVKSSNANFHVRVRPASPHTP